MSPVDWVTCPACGEPDMRQTDDGVVHCTNLECSSNERDHFEFVRDMIPPEATPYVMVRVVEYLDQDGSSRFGIHHRGDVPISTFLGLLELAKIQVVDNAQFTIRGDEDEF